MTLFTGPLDYEKHALRWTLQRLLRNDQDLENLCKFVPRIANAAANVSRTEHIIQGTQQPKAFNTYQEALQELIEQLQLEEEEEN